jgi:hypothetical protein
MTRFENFRVFIWENVWLEGNFSHTNTPTFSNLVILHTYPHMQMEQTECSEKLAYKIQTLENYPVGSIKHSEYGESLKSINPKYIYIYIYINFQCKIL